MNILQQAIIKFLQQMLPQGQGMQSDNARSITDLCSQASMVMIGKGFEKIGITSKYSVECVRDGQVIWIDEFCNLVTTAGLTELLSVVFGAATKAAAHYVGLKAAGEVLTGDTMASHSLWSELAGGTAYTGNRQSYTYGTLQNNVLVTTATTSDTNWQGNWLATHAYTVGQMVKKVADNGHQYKCTTAGTSGATEPVWPTTLGGTVVDGTVTWTEVPYSSCQVDNSAAKAAFPIIASNTVDGAFLCDAATGNGTLGLYGAGTFSAGSRSVLNGDTLNVTITLLMTAS